MIPPKWVLNEREKQNKKYRIEREKKIIKDYLELKKTALSSGGSSPIEVDEMLKTIIEKAKALGMSPKEYMTSPNGLNVPESEAPHLHDSLECLELIHSNNGQNQVGMFGNAPKGGRKRYKKQTYKKRKGNKRTRRR
jgi:hypothetical protein